MAMNLTTSLDITYVALESILPPDLQVHASTAGLCHLRLISTDGQDCLLQVAALPHRLNDPASSPTRRVFTVWVAAEHVAHALPWERAIQHLPAFEVRERLEAEAHLSSCTLPSADDTALSTPVEPISPMETEEQGRQAMTLIPLPEVFVSCETVNETVAEAPEPPLDAPAFRLNRWTRLVWLRAALAMVRRQLVHTRQVFYKLDVLLDKVITAQQRVQQSLVSASAVYAGKRLVGWRLQIALPMTEVLS